MKLLRDIAQGFKDHPHYWWYVFFLIWFIVGMALTDPIDTERCMKHCDEDWR